MAGTIDHPALLGLLNQGFAAVGGDSGHLAADNNNGNGKPGVYLPYLHNYGQTSAWIHDSIALMTPPAKRLVDKFYGKPPKAKYFQGCSTGGAQGFALAQLHPTLFDGIVAGSPGNWYSHLALSFLWNSIRSQVCRTQTLRLTVRRRRGLNKRKTNKCRRAHRFCLNQRSIS